MGEKSVELKKLGKEKIRCHTHFGAFEAATSRTSQFSNHYGPRNIIRRGETRVHVGRATGLNIQRSYDTSFARFRLDLGAHDRKSSVSVIKRSNSTSSSSRRLWLVWRISVIHAHGSGRYSAGSPRATLLRRWELNCANFDRNPLSSARRVLSVPRDNERNRAVYTRWEAIARFRETSRRINIYFDRPTDREWRAGSRANRQIIYRRCALPVSLIIQTQFEPRFSFLIGCGAPSYISINANTKAVIG